MYSHALKKIPNDVSIYIDHMGALMGKVYGYIRSIGTGDLEFGEIDLGLVTGLGFKAGVVQQ